MEHRWGIRDRADLRVVVSDAVGMAALGYLRDISVSGAFLETSHPLREMDRIYVRWNEGGLCSSSTAIEAQVVRCAKEGVGIEWRELAPVEVVLLLYALKTPALTQASSSPERRASS